MWGSTAAVASTEAASVAPAVSSTVTTAKTTESVTARIPATGASVATGVARLGLWLGLSVQVPIGIGLGIQSARLLVPVAQVVTPLLVPVAQVVAPRLGVVAQPLAVVVVVPLVLSLCRCRLCPTSPSHPSDGTALSPPTQGEHQPESLEHGGFYGGVGRLYTVLSCCLLIDHATPHEGVVGLLCSRRRLFHRIPPVQWLHVTIQNKKLRSIIG